MNVAQNKVTYVLTFYISHVPHMQSTLYLITQCYANVWKFSKRNETYTWAKYRSRYYLLNLSSLMIPKWVYRRLSMKEINNTMVWHKFWKSIHFSVRSKFLGAFAKLRKATVKFVTSARLSVRMEQFGSHMVGVHEIWYMNIFRKYVHKTQVSFKSD